MRRSPPSHASAGLLSIVAALAATAVCTMLIDAQISDKPADGRAGHSSSSGLGASSASSGGIMCPKGFADCDGIAANGCEANLEDDPANCGTCEDACTMGRPCSNGKCK